MAKKVISTGGHPVDMESSEEIKTDVMSEVGKMKLKPEQIDGLSQPVKEFMAASSQAQMREAAGVNNSGVAVKGDPGEPGKDGADGQSAEFTVADDAIQWKLDKSTEWNPLVGLDKITGPKGEQGIQGEKGEVGPKGEKGDTGETGTTGPRGITGPAGDTGPAGVTGERGPQGVQGIAGPSGAKGDTGPAGAQGPAGVNATTTSNATASTAGLMSAADKSALDRIGSPVTAVVASGGRPVGTAFKISDTRNARVSYSFGYTLTSALALGQTILIICTVDGVEVARMADGVILGLSGSVQKTKSVTFDVPAGKQVLFTKSGTSSVTATVVSGQETLL